jgi:two-component system nitrogen regulation sensor histidine kinase NtrY
MKLIAWFSRSPEERRRFLEVGAMVIVTIMLVMLSRIEARLLELSKELAEHQEFLTTILFFGQINFNVILILTLAALSFRNIARLVLERKRGIIGSSLKTKLVASLIVFAVAPTSLMFYISYRFITNSFDTWFSTKVQETIAETREAGARVYNQDQRRVESLARIALQRVRIKDYDPIFPGQLAAIDGAGLDGFESEYRLDEVKILDRDGRIVWRNGISLLPENSPWELGTIDSELLTLNSTRLMQEMEKFAEDNSRTPKGMVETESTQDIVRGIAPIYHPTTTVLLGAIIAEEHFGTQILRSIESILNDFANLRPGAQLIRLSYVILLIAMMFLIFFAAVWLGFYVARAITGPILRLAEATEKVAAGDYNVMIETSTDDEAGQLTRQFNAMTKDLQRHRDQANQTAEKLRLSHAELERRGHYMEVVLKSIQAGVLSVDATGLVTSISQSARELLGVKGVATGEPVEIALGAEVYQDFWSAVIEQARGKSEYSGQVDLQVNTSQVQLLFDAVRFFDDGGRELGIVVVFADSTEKIRAQKVAAWREVARRIAHEIKNPITPINLSAERLLRRFENRFTGNDRDVFSGCISTILTQVESLKRVVNEFSRFSRMPTIDTKTEDLPRVIRGVVDLFSLSYPSVHFDLSGLRADLPMVEIDREQMNRAFVNIIANAVEAMNERSEGPRIDISSFVDATSKTVSIEVADNGPGIPNEMKERVFEPYFSTKKDGTGLGLPIVNQIIAEHGGYLRIRERIGGGTIVSIEIPISQREEATDQGLYAEGIKV